MAKNTGKGSRAAAEQNRRQNHEAAERRNLTERLHQFAESQRMDFNAPDSAAMLDRAADALLADERAKRPDRAALERIAAECEADIPYDDGNETAKLIGKRIREALALEPEAREEHCPVDIEPSDTVCAKCSRRQGDGTYAETVEWPCALAEAREEPKHGLIEDYTAVQAPDWANVSGKLDTREVTDAEVEAAWASLSRSSHRWPDISDMRAALRAAREVE